MIYNFGIENYTIEQYVFCCKVGLDDSSGHSSHNHKFVGTGADDSSVLISFIVHLRLISGEILDHLQLDIAIH